LNLSQLKFNTCSEKNKITKRVQKIVKISQEMIFVLYCIYKKNLKWNSKSTFKLSPNLIEYFSNLINFSGDDPICKQCTCQLCRNTLNFLPQPSRMISWQLDEFRDFQTSFAFYRFFRRFHHTFVLMFRKHNVRNFWSGPGYGLISDSVTKISFFSFTFFGCSKHLEFKSKKLPKIHLTKINWRNIVKSLKNV
jgi:hypothetical protein